MKTFRGYLAEGLHPSHDNTEVLKILRAKSITARDEHYAKAATHLTKSKQLSGTPEGSKHEEAYKAHSKAASFHHKAMELTQSNKFSKAYDHAADGRHHGKHADALTASLENKE